MSGGKEQDLKVFDTALADLVNQLALFEEVSFEQDSEADFMTELKGAHVSRDVLGTTFDEALFVPLNEKAFVEL